MDVVTKVFQYLVSNPVRISKISSINVAISTVESPEDIQKDRVCPHPVIVRFASAWDRRLILPSRLKLKNYTEHRLFLCKDRPPTLKPQPDHESVPNAISNSPLSPPTLPTFAARQSNTEILSPVALSHD